MGARAAKAKPARVLLVEDNEDEVFVARLLLSRQKVAVELHCAASADGLDDRIFARDGAAL